MIQVVIVLLAFLIYFVDHGFLHDNIYYSFPGIIRKPLTKDMIMKRGAVYYVYGMLAFFFFLGIVGAWTVLRRWCHKL